MAPVEQALRARRRRLDRLHVRSGKLSPRLQAVVELAGSTGVPVSRADVHSLANLVRNRHHQGLVLECGELPVHDLRDWLAEAGEGPHLILALDQVEDPQNLGSLVRSAAFLGASAVLVHRAHAAPLSPAASKASAGALEFFPVIQVSNLAEALHRLRDEFYTVIGAAGEPEAEDYRQVPPPERTVLVLGNEGEGLRHLTRKRCHVLVRIPGPAEPESLNVGVAGALLLDRFRPRR